MEWIAPRLCTPRRPAEASLLKEVKWIFHRPLPIAPAFYTRRSEISDLKLAAAGAMALELGDHQLGVEGGDQVLQRLGSGLEHLDHALG